MKTLKQTILEGLFKNVGIGSEAYKQEIEDWIKDNFDASNIKIDYVNGEWIVDAKKVLLKNKKATTITNGNFRWGEVDVFGCYGHPYLKSLEGAPTHVKENFNISNCIEITSLKGCEDMSVDGQFSCDHCRNLKSLEFAPKECKEFDCSYNSIIDLKGCEDMKVEYFDCRQCNLRTLEGAPKDCIEFNCESNKFLSNFKGLPKKCDKVICSKCIRTSKDADILKYCNAKQIINKNSFLDF